MERGGLLVDKGLYIRLPTDYARPTRATGIVFEWVHMGYFFILPQPEEAQGPFC